MIFLFVLAFVIVVGSVNWCVCACVCSFSVGFWAKRMKKQMKKPNQWKFRANHYKLKRQKIFIYKNANTINSNEKYISCSHFTWYFIFRCRSKYTQATHNDDSNNNEWKKNNENKSHNRMNKKEAQQRSDGKREQYFKRFGGKMIWTESQALVKHNYGWKSSNNA